MSPRHPPISVQSLQITWWRWESLNGKQRGWYGQYYVLYPAWMDGRKNGRRGFDFDDQRNNLEATILHTAARVLKKNVFIVVNIYS